MKRFSAMIIVSIFFAASINLLSQTREEMLKRVEGWNKQFSAAMISNDKEKMLSFYAEDAYSLPSYTPMLVGKKAIGNSMNIDENSGIKIISFKFNTQDLWISGDQMCEVGTYDLSMSTGDTGNLTYDHGKYLTIYQKQKDGNWKIKADMWNTDTNPFASKQ